MSIVKPDPMTLGFDSSGQEVGEDVTSSPFIIEVAKITSPAGGVTLESGDTETLTWRTNGTARPVSSVNLFYSMNGGLSGKQ
jgi:hypothetical protein